MGINIRTGDEFAIMLDAINTSICKNREEIRAQGPRPETQSAKLSAPSEINTPFLMPMPNIQERPPRGAKEKLCALALKWAARRHKCPVGSAEWEVVFDERPESELHSEEFELEVDENGMEVRTLARILPTTRTILSMEPIKRRNSKQHWSATVMQVEDKENDFASEKKGMWECDRSRYETCSNNSSSSDDYNQFYE